MLKKLRIRNLGPIIEDEVIFEPLTYFVGRNNAGKSHYLKAIELLLASKSPESKEIAKLQHDKTREIKIEGEFEGVGQFTSLVTVSNHKSAIESAIHENTLKVVRVLDSTSENSAFGIYNEDGSVHNPTGFQGNLLKILPETIPIVATADTADELKDKANTALSKLKREAMASFFNVLGQRTREALAGIDEFLHGQETGRRSPELAQFEERLKEELVGEFSDVIPSVEFSLPDEEVIAKEMRILLDDGHKSEIGQKGHGLQRAALLALLRVLARHGTRYQDRPAPIFLIGELESFLHPYAQSQLAFLMSKLIEHYQIVTTTHSPFIVMPDTIKGYRRVSKKPSVGTKAVAPPQSGMNLELMRRHLDRRGNLEGLFADRVILIEGNHDENFYLRLCRVFGIPMPLKKFTLFIRSGGKDELRQARKFYRQMGFDDVVIICDLDYLFSGDAEHLLSELGVDGQHPALFRKHISWTERGDPSLKTVLESVKKLGEPKGLEQILSELIKHRVFVLRHGAPECYYKGAQGQKNGWVGINSEGDLLEPDYLKNLISTVLS